MFSLLKYNLIKIIIDFFISYIYLNFKQQSYGDIHICSLVSSKMVRHFTCSMITCEFYCKERIHLDVFSDGTLTISDRKYLKKVFPKVKFFELTSASYIWKKMKDEYNWLYKFRFDEQVTPVRKKIDMLVFGFQKKFIMIDSDTLFFNVPTKLINFVKLKNTMPLYSIWTKKADDLEQVIREMLKDKYKLQVDSTFNSGLLAFNNASDISLSKINSACRYFYKTGYARNSWLSEETAIQVGINKNAEPLDPSCYLNASNMYQLKKGFRKDITLIHYSGDSGLKIKMLFDYVHFFIPTYINKKLSI